jgi:recombination protein RecT
MDVAQAVDAGKPFTIDGDMVVIDNDDGQQQGGQQEQGQQQRGAELSVCTGEEFAKKTPEWRKVILDKKKTPAELIAFIQTKTVLTEDQQMTITSWAHETE